MIYYLLVKLYECRDMVVTYLLVIANNFFLINNLQNSVILLTSMDKKPLLYIKDS